jgi:hypothetical protein
MELVKKFTLNDLVVANEVVKTEGVFARLAALFSKDEKVLPIFNIIGDTLNGLEKIGINDAIFATVDNTMVFEDQHECKDDLQEALENIKAALDESDHTVVIYLENPGEKLQHVIEVKITQHGEVADVEVVVASAVQNPVNFAPREQYATLLKEKVNENYLKEARAEFNSFCASVSQALHSSLDAEVIDQPVKKVAVIQTNYSVTQFAQSAPRNIQSKKSYPQHFGNSFHSYGYSNRNYMYYYDDSGFDFFDYYMLSLMFGDNEVVYLDQNGNEVAESDLLVLEEIQENVTLFDENISDIIQQEEIQAAEEAEQLAEQQQQAETEANQREEEQQQATILSEESSGSDVNEVESRESLNFGLNEETTRTETPAPSDCTSDCDCACDCSSD